MSHITDIIAAVCILFCGFMGYRRGLVGALAPLIAMVFGYVAALLFAKPVADALIAKGILKGMIAYPVGGIIAFLGVSIAVRLVAWIIERMLQSRLEGGGLGRIYFVAGGAFGALKGALYALILVWGIMLVRAAKASVQGADEDRRPTVSERAASRVIKSLTGFVMKAKGGDDPIGETLSSIMSNPERGLKSIRGVTENDALKEALRDNDFLQTLASGNMEAVEKHPAFEKILDNEEFIESARDLGLVDSDGDLSKVKKQLSATLAKVQKQMTVARDDPKVGELMKDPQMRKILEKGDVASMLNSSEFRELMGSIREER